MDRCWVNLLRCRYLERLRYDHDFHWLYICPASSVSSCSSNRPPTPADLCSGIIGVLNNDLWIAELAFNIFALEALFMVPRICSILSLSPYWGTLIPCLREMAKDFIKFMVLVVIIYLGFLTTFTLIGGDYGLRRMAMILTKIFFGSSYVGFDIMHDIDPIFGPPLMIIFVTLSSILLMGSMTGMLSNSFSRVITHAKEEYLFVYSVYVLEASTSNRLTHFVQLSPSPFTVLGCVGSRGSLSCDVFAAWSLRTTAPTPKTDS